MMDVDPRLIELQRRLDYQFKNVTLLRGALTAADRNPENGFDRDEGNRGLATVGRHLMDLILCCDTISYPDKESRRGKPRGVSIAEKYC